MRFSLIVVMAVFLTFFISNVNKNKHKETKKVKKPNEIIHTVKKGEAIKKTFTPKLEAYDGVASWYGPGFHGKKMANGEIYNQNEILVAHRQWPLGTKVLIINLKNGKECIATIKDRGPYTTNIFGMYTRTVDCSKGLARKLDFIKEGLTPVKIIPINS